MPEHNEARVRPVRAARKRERPPAGPEVGNGRLRVDNWWVPQGTKHFSKLLLKGQWERPLGSAYETPQKAAQALG